MKKLYTTFFVFALYMGAVFSQNAATPNAGFENWTSATGYSTPDNWNTLNATTYGLGAVTCLEATTAGDYHSGLAAIKLITCTVFTQAVQGVATTGTINTTTQKITGGIAYTERPDSIVGWYKSSPVSSDTGFVQFILYGSASTDTIGVGRFNVPVTAVTAFTRFSKPIVYRNTDTPVTSQWILSSSKGSSGQQINSTIWVDDLDLIINSTGISNNSINEVQIKLMNPVSNEIVVYNKAQVNAKLKLVDVLGRNVGLYEINNPENKIDVSALNNGVYLYTIINDKGNVIVNSKLVIQK